MNYLGHLFIVAFLFTASVVCQDSNTTEPSTNETTIVTTPMEQINVTVTAVEPNITMTPSPTTTSLAPPTTTESPIGNWTVTNENGTICIMVMMNAEFHIAYNTTNNGTQTTILPLDPNADVSKDKSSCDDGRMVIEFGKNNLTFNFVKGDKDFSLANITLEIFLDNQTFPDVKHQEARNYSSDGKLFETSNGKSYLCKASTKVSLSGDCDMELKDLQLEAFRTKEDDYKFSDAEECDADQGDVSDIVPIAVGCALAGLVVIVLVAYLVGRRQKRQKGYESV